MGLDAVLLAARPILVPAFMLWGSPVTWLEIVAFVLSIAMVMCQLRVNAWSWPLAIISSLLYALLFADSRLYGEASLQFIFIGVAAWGWWLWLRGGVTDGAAHGVRRLGTRSRWLVAAATLAVWPVLALVLARSTDSDVPWLDALPTVGSIAGQVLLARKCLENWPVWLVVNLISVGLFAFKGLWLTVLLYAVFAGLSWVGWRAWQRLLTPTAVAGRHA